MSGSDHRRRPWWLMAVAYAVAVVSYVAVTLPRTGGMPAQGDASAQRRESKDEITLATVGDIGTEGAAAQVLRAVGKADPDVFLPLGDLSYAGAESEGPWCEMLGKLVGSKVPVQLVSGNHESDTGDDGTMADFARCLPDRRASQGSYPTQYYFDEGTLLRTVVISPDLAIAGHTYAYGAGSEDERWLRSVLDDARRSRIDWIVVAMHKPCISIGRYPCDIGEELLNLLVDYRVDLVLAGHDHTYQRSVQLGLSPLCRAVELDGPVNMACVADDGRDRKYRSGEGALFVVVGSGGQDLYPLDDGDSDRPYVATAMGANRDPTIGFLKLEIDTDSIRGRFEKASGPGSFGDRFEVAR